MTHAEWVDQIENIVVEHLHAISELMDSVDKIKKENKQLINAHNELTKKHDELCEEHILVVNRLFRLEIQARSAVNVNADNDIKWVERIDGSVKVHREKLAEVMNKVDKLEAENKQLAIDNRCHKKCFDTIAERLNNIVENM